MLKIEHLTKNFGNVTAVSDLSLHIAPGEIYGFIGHNGAGKTTTIKSCCGILRFDSGEIFVDGMSIKTDPLRCKQEMAYIPDNPDLYEFLSGIKYISFIADVFGVNETDREARIAKYADMFGLTDDLAQPISAYSHGMKQKLALIAAFVHKPKLIIMDEPFVGLDPKASFLLKQEMRMHCGEGGALRNLYPCCRCNNLRRTTYKLRTHIMTAALEEQIANLLSFFRSHEITALCSELGNYLIVIYFFADN